MSVIESDDTTNQLFDAIRKELNEIINVRTSSDTALTDDVDISKKKKDDANSRKPQFPNSRGRPTKRHDNQNNRKTSLDNADITQIKPTETIPTVPSQNIDIELQRMQLDLKQSYELFQSIGEKFEAINFGCLKNRIKDLSLSKVNANDAGKASKNELQNLFENNYVNNRLDKLTSDMGEQFRKHPGEFGDIPEVSAFFTACTQLQNGLEKLKRQRNDVTELGKRISIASEASYDRIEEIKRTLDEKTKTENAKEK